jgi:hypothetical protein
MKKTILTILLIASFTTTINAKENFHLQKAESFNTIVSQNDTKKGDFNKYSCIVGCYVEFNYCTQGLNPQSIDYEYCEMDLDLCLIYRCGFN